MLKLSQGIGSYVPTRPEKVPDLHKFETKLRVFFDGKTKKEGQSQGIV
jgi:hypothetical protein